MHVPLDSYSTVTYQPPTYQPPVPPPSPTPNDDHDNVDDIEIRSAVDYPREPVEWLWPGKIPIGKVTLLIGDPGLGKSLVALDVASRVTRGAGWPEEERQGDKETRRGGDTENRRRSRLPPCLLVSQPPCLVHQPTRSPTQTTLARDP